MHQCRTFRLLLLRRAITRKSDLMARVILTLIPIANKRVELLLLNLWKL